MTAGNLARERSALLCEGPRHRPLPLVLHEALCWIRLGVHLQAHGDGPLRDNLSALLRGCLGAALHDLCADIHDRAPTAYHYLFETLRPADAGVLRSNVDVPRPYVLRTDANAPSRARRGELLPFELILIGRGCRYLPEVLGALRLMGQRGLGRDRVPYSLRGLWQHFTSRSSLLLYDGGAPCGEPIEERLEPRLDDHQRDEVTVELLTPARIVVDGKQLRDAPSFAQLLRAAMRRLSSLAAFHGDQQLELDFGALLERAQSVSLVDAQLGRQAQRRWSSRQRREIGQQGLVGTLRYRGARVGELLPVLRLAAELHVGKGAVLGAGRLRVR